MTTAVAERTAYAVPELELDAETRLRAARFIGACALSNEANVGPAETVKPIESLYDAIRLAAEGNAEAYSMVETNVRTDIIERTIKSGHIIAVDLHIDEAGKILQHGQSMESVQANSLRYAANSWQMRERTEAEATNAFRIEQLYDSGMLEDYSFVVFSRAADNMTREEMDDAGFFTETMSCAIQVTSATGNRLSTESAFVAGVKTPGAERHDAKTVVDTAAILGVDLDGKNAAEIINTPLLVHNSLLKNGVADIVKMYDEAAGGTFFGESKPQQDYIDYKHKCVEREHMLKPKVASVVNELITEAPTIRDRVHAAKRLHKLSEKHMVQQAVFDKTINPRVFGSVAAVHIEQARVQFELGNNDAGLQEVNKAITTAKSSSCPSGAGSSSSAFERDNKPSEKDCEFVSKQCPICKAKNVKTKVTKHRITGSCGCVKNK